MDKRNRPALAYLLVGVASAGRAMLAMPDAVALQEVSLTVLALVGYLLLGRRALPRAGLRHRAVGAGTGAVRALWPVPPGWPRCCGPRPCGCCGPL